MNATVSNTAMLTIIPAQWRQLMHRALQGGGQVDGGQCTFYLYRLRDRSGVSGTGIVAEGRVLLPEGSGVMWWTVPGIPSTCALFASMTDLEIIHGHGGDTRIVWGDEAPGSGAA